MVVSNSNSELNKTLTILSRQPKNIGAHIQAGVLFSQEEKWDKSAFHLKKALAGDKRNPLILEKLTDVLIHARQPLKARQYARKLLDVNKRNPSALNTMAKVHVAMEEIEKALHWIDLALEMDPGNEQYLLEKAEMYSMAGDMEKSLDIHKSILKQNPLSSHSWWPVAQLQKLDGEDAKKAIRQIELAIRECEQDGDLRGMHYAAGKILQDNGEFKKAFEYFEKANTLHEHDIMADRIIAAHINIRETYTPEFFASIKGDRQETSNDAHRPIFILGQTRSGTTLTESLCASHSRVVAGGELPHFSDFNKRLEIFSIAGNIHAQNIHELTPANLREMANDFISKTRHLQQPGKRLTDKMPHNFLNLGLIPILFPNARIIHCRRHPMDNCLSIFSNPMRDYHKEYKSKLEVLGEYYRNYAQIMEFWKETCPIPIHDVYYEDLVTNTENVARGIIEYLDEEWEEGVMERSGSQKAVKTLSVWQVRQPVFQSSKGKWRNYEKQLQPLRNAMGTCVEDYEKELAQLNIGK